MHPEIVAIFTYIRSDTISTRPYEPNTLTCQSAGTNNSPRDTFHSPVTWNPARHIPLSSYIFVYVQGPVRHQYLRKHLTLLLCFDIPPIAASVIHGCNPCRQNWQLCMTQQFRLDPTLCSLLDPTHWFLTWFYSLVPDLIWLTSSWLYSTHWFLTLFESMVLTWFDSSFPTWSRSLFPTRFISQFLTRFDSVFFGLTCV